MRRSVESTAYCLTGTMASGKEVYDGAVAMNDVKFGARWRIQSGDLAGKEVTVEDRIGWGSEFDVWMASCDAADLYGRQQVTIEEVR